MKWEKNKFGVYLPKGIDDNVYPYTIGKANHGCFQLSRDCIIIDCFPDLETACKVGSYIIKRATPTIAELKKKREQSTESNK